MSLPLSPTDRTTVRRGQARAADDREVLHALLDDALVAHLGVVVGGDGDGAGDGAPYPVVLPVAFAVDLAGPDDGGTLYVHGSVAARWLGRSGGATVCVTLTELDGLVAARSAFHHSMNYRSAVVIGAARVVVDAGEKQHALDLTVDHMVPGRAATLRPSTRKELAATAVLAVPLAEASVKVRAEGPVDDAEDVAAGTWGGVVPLRRVAGAPEHGADSHDRVPEDVRRRAVALGAPADH